MGKELVKKAVKKAKRVLKAPKSLTKTVGAPTSATSKGPLPPSKWPPGCGVSKSGRKPGRPFWLPADWAVSVKTTCRTFLPCFISPERKTFYHKPDIEKHLGYQLGPEATRDGATRWALDRMQALEDWTGNKVATPDDSRLFELLSQEERALLPPTSAFHVGVVSARRATDPVGIKDIATVEVALRAAGVSAKWYVDAASLEEYRALGLDAVVGGKLTPARNMALDDAAKANKICVQVSDDIARWQYWKLDKVIRSDSQSNRMVRQVKKSGNCLGVSPAAAMRFMAAKMRAAGAKLGGVYPQANISRAFSQEVVTTENFILGDFFVADKSPVRFDESMTLKEDYDYTCAHLAEHGKVMRFNRLIIIVKHATNAGGAVSVRDSQGVKEQQNIDILMRKWPGVFRANPHRAHEVVLTWRWRRDKTVGGGAAPRALKRTSSKASKPAPAAKLRRAQAKAKKDDDDLPAQAVVKLTEKGKESAGYLGRRCSAVDGTKVGECVDVVKFRDLNGKTMVYSRRHFNYDLQLKRLTLTGANGKAYADSQVAKYAAAAAVAKNRSQSRKGGA